MSYEITFHINDSCIDCFVTDMVEHCHKRATSDAFNACIITGHSIKCPFYNNGKDCSEVTKQDWKNLLTKHNG